MGAASTLQATHTRSDGNTELYSYQITDRDASGRIKERIESVNGVSTVYAYGYDLSGQLKSVSVNGNEVSAYTYDANGNRLCRSQTTGGACLEGGLYDGQDRVTSYGGASYTFTRSGSLSTKTRGSQTTGYQYDVFGNLRRVDLPDGRVIRYQVDGRNRRVAKTVQATSTSAQVLERRWLYQDQLEPVDEFGLNYRCAE